MIPPVYAIKKVLFGNINYKGNIIPVIKRSYPYDHTPCVTIDDGSASNFVNRHIITEDYPVSQGHPLFNPENPFEKFPQQVLREVFQVSVNINVWSDTITEQEDLNNIIMDLFHKAESDYYLFCDQYNDGYCSYMDNTCFAKHFYDTSKLSIRGVKGQCPNPKVYGYKNIFEKYNLYRDSFIVDQPFNLDDTSKKEILYRSVIRLHTGYYIDHIIGGLNFKKVDYKSEV